MTGKISDKTMQDGFSVVGVVLIIIVLALVGFGGWTVMNQNKKSKSNAATAKTVQYNKPANDSDSSNGWLTFKNEKSGITFQYPSDWKNEATELKDANTGQFDGAKGTVTSPQGKALTWIYNFAGGGGGGPCEPAANDAPFKAGDLCPSLQVISVEKVQKIKAPADAPRDVFEDNLYITRTKYLSNVTGSAVSYQICLDAYSADMAPKVETYMGFVLKCHYLKTGFNARFDVKDEADFNSSEAKTAEKIMKSFTTYHN